MAIQIGVGKRERDLARIASATAEAIIQAKLLGLNGFSNAVSALFRALENVRGDDSTELRATSLVLDVLSYATAATFSRTRLERSPVLAELQEIIKAVLSRAQILAEQEPIFLERKHLEAPGSFCLFSDAASRVFSALKLFGVKESEADSEAIFREAVAEGVSRVIARRPSYFEPALSVLAGPGSEADVRSRAWQNYRAKLIERFEEEPLFCEDPRNGVFLAQIYQPLRAWWEEEKEEREIPEGMHLEGGDGRKRKHHLLMLEDTIVDWLDTDDESDRVRLISGGPGSGKSTFAKYIAAKLALQPRWRVVFVPLQRLKGPGSLSSRIDEYFRVQRDEPFDGDTAPIANMGKDGHRDWLIIFDGLDELAKEGTGSESAAQDFASSMNDLKVAIGQSAAVRMIVLGRAPSMQAARKRLGLYGSRTLYVADMAPLKTEYRSASGAEIVVKDPNRIAKIDQRNEFWTKWAVAKGLSTQPPEGMTAETLSDLTKEPLLAYLLIMSGYIGENWRDAAENRNRIYRAIFEKIWDRERGKQTRVQLNEFGKLGFDALMQALGLAAWRGGGRTGDESTFSSMRDIFMRPDLLQKANSLGVADLDNVALLFYTQKDEDGGQGYEFLHKSFGEYLTACALLSASRRWGKQVEDVEADFNKDEFLRRWLKLTGPSPITPEILSFLRNEARLQAFDENNERPWEVARSWVRVLENVCDEALVNGLPAHEGAQKWRIAEKKEHYAEVALLALLDACGRVAYPIELCRANEAGGWQPGPINIDLFRKKPEGFAESIQRLIGGRSGGLFYSADVYYPVGPVGLLGRCLSRLNLDGSILPSYGLDNADFEGASFVRAVAYGVRLFATNLSYTNLRWADLSGVMLVRTEMRHADLSNAILEYAVIEGADLSFANLEGAKGKFKVSAVSLEGTNLRGTRLRRPKKTVASAKDGRGVGKK